MDTLLITGGCGFIGSNFIRYALGKHPGWHIVNLDKLTYAGNPDNLREIESDDRYTFIHGDICDRELVDNLFRERKISGVINFAAESHVDRSIMDATAFIETNVNGTMVLLDAARQYGIERFLQISTDEVYGELGDTGYFTETSPVQPNSPYAASKAGADLLVKSYYRTYGLPVMIARSSNNFGPYQYPEKMIPLMIILAMEDKPLPVYGDGMNVRDWLYVDDNCAAIDAIFAEGTAGEVYNAGGNMEIANVDLVKKLLEILGKPDELISFVTDRPGHDRRYALDNSKIERELGWQPGESFDDNLRETVLWYSENEDWWKKVLDKNEYKTYYQKMYTKQKEDVR